jgi:hypothetical protein
MLRDRGYGLAYDNLTATQKTMYFRSRDRSAWIPCHLRMFPKVRLAQKDAGQRDCKRVALR